MKTEGFMRDITYFWKKKQFAVGFSVVLILAYLTQVLNPTVGTDDTAFKLYFVDGVAPAAGRWSMYLLQKVIPLNYNPYFMEVFELLCFALSATLWCVLFKRIMGDRVPDVAYTVFAGVLAANPIHAEVAVWYLQNGNFAAYGLTALALIFLLESLRNDSEGTQQVPYAGNRIGALFLGTLCLWIAVGFYESFMIVFLVGFFLCFLLVRAMKIPTYQGKLLCWAGKALVMVLASVCLRGVIMRILYVAEHLENQQLLETRSVSEVLGWFNGSRGMGELLLVMKESFLKYCLHGLIYFPIFLLVLAALTIIFWALRCAVIQRDICMMAGLTGLMMSPWIMPFLEGRATFYRAAQYVPVLTAFAVFPLALLVQKLRGQRFLSKLAGGIAVCGTLLVLYRECYDMNYAFYLEKLKYEDTVRTMDEIAMQIQKNCDVTKPVCAVGAYDVPGAIVEMASVPYWSKKYKILCFFAEEELMRAYSTPYGYCAAETPRLSAITWAVGAFHTYDRELIKFWKMQGYWFLDDLNYEDNMEALALMDELPAWPKDGAVTEMENYILVNFGR